MTVTFARRLFLVAGIYGVAVLAPMFFVERLIGEYDPPAITHAEFYYGFVFAAFAWQIVYLMLARDPLRFRPMLLPAIVSKAGFGLSVFALVAQGRLAAANAVLPSVDLVLAGLFAWAYVSLGRHAPPGER